MMNKTIPTQRTILLLLTLFLLGSCGMWMFDWAGKGQKVKCLFLSTKSMQLHYECGDKRMAIVTIAGSTSSDGSKRRLFRAVFESPAKDFLLSQDRDSLNGLYVEIEIRLTGSHHRESYYIHTQPGDFAEDKVVYARYFSH